MGANVALAMRAYVLFKNLTFVTHVNLNAYGLNNARLTLPGFTGSSLCLDVALCAGASTRVSKLKRWFYI